MAEEPRWTYGHAWFTWELVRREEPFWRPDRFASYARFWTGDDAAPFWDRSLGGIPREERFAKPVREAVGGGRRPRERWVCPRGAEDACARLQAAMEPPERNAVALACDVPAPAASAADASRLALNVDLQAPNVTLTRQFLELVRRERAARGLRERRRPRGGSDVWGFLGPVLAIEALDEARAEHNLAEWWSLVEETPELAEWARKGERRNAIAQVRRLVRTMPGAVARDCWIAYRYE